MLRAADRPALAAGQTHRRSVRIFCRDLGLGAFDSAAAGSRSTECQSHCTQRAVLKVNLTITGREIYACRYL